MHFLKKWYLHRYGRQVMATVSSAGEVRGPAGGRINVNLGQNVYHITALWTDEQSGTTYTFEKKGLTDHPLPIKEGQQVAVLIDPANPKKYEIQFK